MKTRHIFLPLLAAAAMTVSCATTPRGMERLKVLWGEGEAALLLDERSFQLSGGPLGSSRISGRVSSAADGIVRLEAEKLHWFSNWTDGWTEAVFVLTGEAELREAGSAGTARRLAAAAAPEWEYLESAAIRYRDDVLRGEEALSLLDRRYGRIRVAADFLKEELDRPYYPLFRTKKKKPAADAFFPPASRLLFPEVYGYAGGGGFGRPEKADLLRAEGITWNAAYSRERIREDLREVRDSGTLFRDWEEAAELFYLLYIWDELWAAR